MKFDQRHQPGLHCYECLNQNLALRFVGYPEWVDPVLILFQALQHSFFTLGSIDYITSRLELVAVVFWFRVGTNSCNFGLGYLAFVNARHVCGWVVGWEAMDGSNPPR